MIQCVVNLPNADIHIRGGEDHNIPLTFTDENDAAFDITGAKIHFVAKKHLSSVTKIIDKEVTSHSDPVNGKSTVVLTNVDTKPLRGSYYYSIELEQSDGTQVLVSRGNVIVESVSTKDE